MSAEPRQHASVSSVTAGAPVIPKQGTAAVSMLDLVLQSSAAPTGVQDPSLRASRIEAFLGASSDQEALAAWLGKSPQSPAEWRRARLLINRDIAELDDRISEQVNHILHHPEFQQLESTWRGLWLLTGAGQDARDVIDRDGERGQVSIRILNLSRRELKRDFERANEFDQSQLFRKVYEEEFGMAGGEPYGLLLTDFQFSNHPDDLDMLGRLSEVAAASFAPLIAAPKPQLLGIDSFSTLQQPLDYDGLFAGPTYTKWRALRERVDTQFLGLALPNILMRPPHDVAEAAGDCFRFQEDLSLPDRQGYLWGSAAWAMGMVAIRAYAECGWFADIRGVSQGILGGGLVTGLPAHEFSTDASGVAPKTSVDVAISEPVEAELSRQGFIPLCACHDTPLSAFFSNSSVHAPKKYDDLVATTNARISAMMQYTLCASRFAHYLKILGRQKVGSFQSASQLQDYLNVWLANYITPDEAASPSVKAQYPLRRGETEVKELSAKPGSYQVLMHLQPHYQLDQLSAAIKFQAQISPLLPDKR